MKNIILITVDCLRADHIGSAGYHRKTTPFLDELAKKGVNFTNAISVGSMTRQSFPAILGSVYPSMVADLNNSMDSADPLAEVLAKAGYSTGAFHSNVVISKKFGYQKGFDVFEDDLTLKKSVMKKMRFFRTKKFLRPMLRLLANLKIAISGGKSHKISAEQINKKAIGWMTNQKKPFFAWLHYMDVHGAYLPENKYLQKFREKHITRKQMYDLWRKIVYNLSDPSELTKDDIEKTIDLYDACILYVDECISQLVQELKRHNKLDDTILIITADHGEEFLEHGGITHRRKLYDELIHVPLIMFNLPYNKRIDQVVSTIDLAPTILDIASAQIPKSYCGKSLIPLIEGKRKNTGVISETDAVYEAGKLVCNNCRHISYRTSKWKLIFTDRTEQKLLFDLKNDPNEQKDVSDKFPEVTSKLLEKIKNHIRMDPRKKNSKILENIKI